MKANDNKWVEYDRQIISVRTGKILESTKGEPKPEIEYRIIFRYIIVKICIDSHPKGPY